MWDLGTKSLSMIRKDLCEIELISKSWSMTEQSTQILRLEEVMGGEADGE